MCIYATSADSFHTIDLVSVSALLDLSHNKLGDGAGRAIAKLLNNHCVLHTLDISNNRISEPGGSSIGHALQNNTHLKILNMKLNR